MIDADDRSRRFATVLNRLERIYLAAIRVIALLVATLLVLFALWLAISGTWKWSRDAASVVEQPAAVSADEVADVDLRQLTRKAPEARSDPLAGPRRYYAGFAGRYYQLYRSRFAPYRQADDPALDAKAFEARFVRSGERIDRIGDGGLNFAQDKTDLDTQLETMTDVAARDTTAQRLRAYRGAKKIRTTRVVSGTRQERYCSYYGYYINACIDYDTRTIPYSRKVTEVRPPAGVVSPVDLFAAYQDHFKTLLSDRRGANAATANTAREKIVAGNVDGAARLGTAVRIVGAFVVLMFLFLLIALERHQRRIARATPSD